MAIFPFAPSSTSPFEFQPTLDGLQYTVTVTWNVFARRYYINIFQLDGVRVLTKPLVGSPIDYDLSLTAGYFTSKIVFRQQSQRFEVTP